MLHSSQVRGLAPSLALFWKVQCWQVQEADGVAPWAPPKGASKKTPLEPKSPPLACLGPLASRKAACSWASSTEFLRRSCSFSEASLPLALMASARALDSHALASSFASLTLFASASCDPTSCDPTFCSAGPFSILVSGSGLASGLASGFSSGLAPPLFLALGSNGPLANGPLALSASFSLSVSSSASELLPRSNSRPSLRGENLPLPFSLDMDSPPRVSAPRSPLKSPSKLEPLKPPPLPWPNIKASPNMASTPWPPESPPRAPSTPRPPLCWPDSTWPDCAWTLAAGLSFR
mmetsp:Transcript_25822/g.57894  ORF Transcript_25822/g.57894 Transcript_25822/m.57894 type:complete len:293 (+) Transcript_25822:250-1128(+)